MTNAEAVNWLINITADIGKAEHSDLWHYEQALSEIREMLEDAHTETHDNRTETHACDLVDRQAAIDALGEKPLVWDDLSDFDLGKAAQWSDDVDAIKALPSTQPQPCKDAVSKADVLETYAELYDVFDDNKEIKNELHKIYDKINALQAAQPQRIKGRWERKESDLSWWYECSECGESPLFDPYEHEVRTPFCPWCGVEMQDEQE